MGARQDPAHHFRGLTGIHQIVDDEHAGPIAAAAVDYACRDVLEDLQIGLASMVIACHAYRLDHPDAQLARHDRGRDETAAGDADNRVKRPRRAQTPSQRPGIAMELVPGYRKDFCRIEGPVRFGSVHSDRCIKNVVSQAYRALIQSITWRRAASAVVRCPAKTSTYWLFEFLASALKAYSGPRRSIGSSLPTTQSSGTGAGAAPISAAFLGITAGPSGSNQLK